MTTQTKLAAFLLFAGLHLQLSTAFAQGSLTPPGAPAATMKTLAQIEPRTPISSAPFTISTPGSYYLTTNLTTTVSNAIIITANGVTLDLGGWTIASTVANAANGGTAILLSPGLSDITIANGHIRGGVTNNGSNVYGGSGFDGGISFPTGSPRNVLVSRVTVTGCLSFGIDLLNGTTMVESCAVRTTGSYGIIASTVKSSTAADCGNTAITGDSVSDCRGDATGTGSGISAITANNCVGNSSGSGNGIICNGTASGCSGTSGGGTAVGANIAINCSGTSSGSGIGVTGLFVANNCYGTCNGSGYGVSTSTANNCYGICNGSGTGVSASTAIGCYGTSISGTGLFAFIAEVCHGQSNSGTALSVTHNVNSF